MKLSVLKSIAIVFMMIVTASSALGKSYPSTLNIGSTAPGHLKFILLQHHGWLEEELKPFNVKVNYHPFVEGGSIAVQALATGSIDIAYVGNNPSLRIGALDAGINIIGLSNYVKSSGSSIVVANDSEIKTIEDLKGKRVAFLQGTVRHSTLAKALATVDLTTKDIITLNMPFSSSGPALIRGEIDAFVESENSAGELLQRGAARILLDGADYPEWSAPNAILTRKNLIDTHPDIVQILLDVDLKISQWADDNWEETIVIFAEATQSNVDVLKRTYADGKFHQDPLITEEAVNAFKLEEAFMQDAELIRGQVDYDRWINDSFVKESYRKAGLL